MVYNRPNGLKSPNLVTLACRDLERVASRT